MAKSFFIVPSLMLIFVSSWTMVGCNSSSTRIDDASASSVKLAVSKVFPALVRITVVTEAPNAGSMQKNVGAGSGAIISADGYVITNHHVAGKASHLLCRLYDGEEIEATLVGTDALADIAVIKLDLSRRSHQTPLAVATFADSDLVRLGDPVLAMGSPMAVTQSITKGIVSNLQLMMPSLFWQLDFKLDGENVGSIVRWLGHDAVIFGGNSGGPLVNLEGEIIGINEVSLASLGGAIPSNLARSVAEQIIRQGYVERSWTGLEPQPWLRDFDLQRGVQVAGVIQDSPADKAGLRAGDVVTHFDGVAVNGRKQEDLPVFNSLVMGTPIGKTVPVVFFRDGKEHSCALTTTARGKANDDDIEFKNWGLTGQNLTRLSAMERRRPDTQGVLVTSIDPTGPAGTTKPALQAGDCIQTIGGKAVANANEMHDILSEISKDLNGAPVAVEFDRNFMRMITSLRIKPVPAVESNARKPSLAMQIQAVGTELVQALKLERGGARIVFVFPGSAAEKAGFRVGDILTSFADESVQCRDDTEIDHFLSAVRRHRIGEEVACEVIRDQKPMKLLLSLTSDDPTEEEMRTYKDVHFDFALRDMSVRERSLKRIPDNVKGPLVTNVKASGWASLAHVSVGDMIVAIDGTPTPDVATAERLLKSAAERKAKRVLLNLRHGIHTFFTEIEPTWKVIPTSQSKNQP